MIEYKKIPYFKFIPVIILTLLCYKFINNIESIGFFIGKLLDVFSYILWGFIIAYLLNPAMVYLEKHFKLKRIFSLLIVYLFFIAIVILIITLIIPLMIKSIADLLANLNMQTILTNTQSFWDYLVKNNSLLNKLGIDSNINTTINTTINKYITQVNSILTTSISLVFSQLVNITTTLFKIFTGAVISIYLLIEKESAIKGIKKILYAFFSASATVSIIKFGGKVNIIFKKYFIGKSIDSFIIGIICFIVLSLLGVQFPLLISIIIGITNLIPYFGNFIGLVPTFIITFFFSPVQALQLTVLVLFISILDGWVLAPKIIGDKIGLGPVWIIIAIILGGSLYGVVGMFLGVPIIAILKALIEDIVDRRIKAKNIDIDELK